LTLSVCWTVARCVRHKIFVHTIVEEDYWISGLLSTEFYLLDEHINIMLTQGWPIKRSCSGPRNHSW